LLINAKAWTGNPSQPWVETVGIKGSRIIAVGSKSLETEFKANKTIDAGGKLVLPGVIVNHVHFLDGAVTLLALEIAGIDRDTPDREGGLTVRDLNGDPTGMLKDNALLLVTRKMPKASDEQNTRMFNAATEEGLKHGVTQIYNVNERESQWDNIAIFEKAKTEGRLKIRAYYIPHITNRHRLAERIKAPVKGDEWLRFGGVKQLVDGSLGSTTAWYYQTYSDVPETSGFPLMQMDELKATIADAHELGLQLMIHAIGDRTNNEILRIFDELNVKDSRPGIEHAQHLSPACIKRFAELGVIPSMHP
jgi:predicted amidohydrolase YtcJ